MKTRALSILLLLAAALLPGCAVGPDVPASITPPPARFSEATSATPTAGVKTGEMPADFAFWRELGDPRLASLVERALSSSPDVARATSRIRESRALASAAWKILLPEIDAGASYDRTRLSTESPLLSKVGAANFPGFTPDADDWKAQLSMAYELDIWGKNRRASEAARDDLEGDVERRRAAGLTLAGDVATTYIDLRTIQVRRGIAARAVESRKAALGLARDRAAGGMGADLDVARAEVEVASAIAAIPDLDRLASIDEHRLSVLVGAPPGSLRATLAASHGTLRRFDVPVGIPAQLLTRRPDVREASLRVAAATARIGEAKANVLPQITLQGSLGVEAFNAQKLASRAAGYWSAGPSLSIPLFDAGRRIDQWTAAEERADEALRDLEKQVLTALEEVEDAIVSAREDARRRDALADAVAAARRAEELATIKYQGGLVSNLDVIDAQRALLQAEDALALAEGSVLKDAVQLAKAVGGGFAAEESLLPPLRPVEKP